MPEKTRRYVAAAAAAIILSIGAPVAARAADQRPVPQDRGALTQSDFTQLAYLKGGSATLYKKPEIPAVPTPKPGVIVLPDNANVVRQHTHFLEPDFTKEAWIPVPVSPVFEANGHQWRAVYRGNAVAGNAQDMGSDNGNPSGSFGYIDAGAVDSVETATAEWTYLQDGIRTSSPDQQAAIASAVSTVVGAALADQNATPTATATPGQLNAVATPVAAQPASASEDELPLSAALIPAGVLAVAVGFIIRHFVKGSRTREN